jgi:hypothetical protein
LSELNGHIEELVRLAEACDAEGIRKALKQIVPEYTPWREDSRQEAAGSGQQAIQTCKLEAGSELVDI